MDSQISRTSETVNTDRYFEEMARLWEPLLDTSMHSLVFAHMLMCMAGQPDLEKVPADHQSLSMLVRPAHSGEPEPQIVCETLQQISPELKFAQFSPTEHARNLIGLQQAILDMSAGRCVCVPPSTLHTTLSAFSHLPSFRWPAVCGQEFGRSRHASRHSAHAAPRWRLERRPLGVAGNAGRQPAPLQAAFGSAADSERVVRAATSRLKCAFPTPHTFLVLS